MAQRRRGRLKFNMGAFDELKNSPEARAALMDIATDMARDLNQGQEQDWYIVTDLVLEDPRAAVSVLATGKGAVRNYKNHTLLKELMRRAV